MFLGKIFSKERSLLLFWRKLPDSYASFNGENFIASKRVAFILLALALPDSVKTQITIAYPERNIMECTLMVIVLSVNAGNVINTRREVVEAVSLMLFKMDLGPSRTIKSWLFRGLLMSLQQIHYSMKSSHIFRKLAWAKCGKREGFSGGGGGQKIRIGLSGNQI